MHLGFVNLSIAIRLEAIAIGLSFPKIYFKEAPSGPQGFLSESKLQLSSYAAMCCNSPIRFCYLKQFGALLRIGCMLREAEGPSLRRASVNFFVGAINCHRPPNSLLCLLVTHTHQIYDQ